MKNQRGEATVIVMIVCFAVMTLYTLAANIDANREGAGQQQVEVVDEKTQTNEGGGG